MMIKREPRESADGESGAAAPRAPGAVPIVAVPSGGANRLRLRALLDRARQKTTEEAASSSVSSTAVVTVAAPATTAHATTATATAALPPPAPAAAAVPSTRATPATEGPRPSPHTRPLANVKAERPITVDPRPWPPPSPRRLCPAPASSSCPPPSPLVPPPKPKPEPTVLETTAKTTRRPHHPPPIAHEPLSLPSSTTMITTTRTNLRLIPLDLDAPLATARGPSKPAPLGSTRPRDPRPSPSPSPSSPLPPPPPSSSSSSSSRRQGSVAQSPEDLEASGQYDAFVHSLEMLIPESAIGCLIGPRGEIIRHLRTTTGCTLSIREPGAFPCEADRVLRLYGKSHQICHAQRLVIERIRVTRMGKNDPNYLKLGAKEMVRLADNHITQAMADAISSHEDEENRRVTVRWLVPRDRVGRIMGHEGSILRLIASGTNTSIHVSSIHDMAPGSSERVVTIVGTASAAEEARQMIEEKAGGRPEGDGTNGKLGQYYAIPYHAAGFLIGPQGSRVRKLNDQSGARIQFPTQENMPLGSVNRILHIQGTTEQMNDARALILQRLKQFANQSDARREEVDEIFIKLLLPVRICGLLLCQRGQLIKGFTDAAGAHARFLQQSDNETRICLLYGEMHHVLYAQRLILEYIAADAITTKRAPTSGLPPRKRKYTSSVDDADHASSLSQGRRSGQNNRSQACSLPGRQVLYTNGITQPSTSSAKRPRR